MIPFLLDWIQSKSTMQERRKNGKIVMLICMLMLLVMMIGMERIGMEGMWVEGSVFSSGLKEQVINEEVDLASLKGMREVDCDGSEVVDKEVEMETDGGSGQTKICFSKNGVGETVATVIEDEGDNDSETGISLVRLPPMSGSHRIKEKRTIV
eukprot:TRINITY_DN1506_c0_g1_i1.p2 TRINITY_DN1506_c0_g1~~TRINITY_DN1506_c0_g1_i1.p2  ORF type:complete len:153 (-),score=41.63 TRINITY_DN1506_c0_g1_i1:887-1345(-)